MNGFGLLLTITEPPPAQEAEFNAWYDSEHIAARLSISGFLSARRWVADVKPGEGKYLATYDPGDAPPHMMSYAQFVAIGDAPPEHEDEFNRWYDEEHIPLLSRVPGVLRARRFFDPNGKPRYVALYDLADAAVLQHPEWQAALRTEWARKIDKLTAGREWILRLYQSYTPAA